MSIPFLSRFATFRNYRTFVQDIGYPRFFLIQALGGLAGFLTVLSLSALFGVLALFVSNDHDAFLVEISGFRLSQLIPEYAKQHLLGFALLLTFLFVCLKLVASVAYCYYSTLF